MSGFPHLAYGTPRRLPKPDSLPGRVVVIKPLQKLAFRQRYQVSVKKGIVAGEGTLASDRRLSWNFGTWLYYPLKVSWLSCRSRLQAL